MNQYGTDLQPAGPRPSAWGALLRIITEPEATIRDFGDRIPIFPGYLLQMVLSGVMTYLMIPATMAMLDQQFATQGIPPEQMGMVRTVSLGSALATSLFTPWIAGLFTALLAMFFGQFRGGGVGFVQYLGLVGYARIPVALGGVLSGAMIMASGSVMNAGISLAALLPEGSSPYLMGILGAFNPFTFWYYAVLAIGFGVLHKGGAKKGLSLVITMFIVTLLMSLGSGASLKMAQGLQ
jgi:hypothetical protein